MTNTAAGGSASRSYELPRLHHALPLLLLAVGACASSSSAHEESPAALAARSEAPAQPAACAAVADSVLASVPKERLPWAIPDHRLRYPAPPRDAAVGIPVETFAVVGPDGGIDSTTFRVTGTGDGDYKRAMLRTISKARWRPARVGECAVWSRISIKVTDMGVR
jgi:hypothetical protein